MRGLALASLWIVACSSPAPPPIERATPVDPAPSYDAAVAIVEEPPPADAGVAEPPPRLSPIEQLPPSGEPALPEHPSQDLIDARYALAVQHATEPLALSLLLDIAVAAGGEAIEHARWDDALASVWDQRAFQQMLSLEPPELADDAHIGEDEDFEDGVTVKLACPKGTKQKHKGYADWCQRANGVKHGPYRYYEEGYDMSEGVAAEHGRYVDGKKDGTWYWSESFSGWSYGMYRKGVMHGLWEVSGRESYEYIPYVDGKEHGVVRMMSIEGDDRVIGEHRYDHGVLHGDFIEWDQWDPYDLQVTGTWDRGKQHGEWKTYGAGGVVTSVQHYDAGVAHGAFVYYDDAGKVLAKTTMDHGSGAWIAYDARGLLAEGELVGNVKQGKWGERELYGESWESGAYVDGKRDGEWTQWDHRAGQKLRAGAYAKGQPTGDWIWLLPDGKTRATGTFANGKATGTWEVTDETGVTQKLVLKAGKLVKIDGKSPTKAERDDFKGWSPTEPTTIVPAQVGDDWSY